MTIPEAELKETLRGVVQLIANYRRLPDRSFDSEAKVSKVLAAIEDTAKGSPATEQLIAEVMKEEGLN